MTVPNSLGLVATGDKISILSHLESDETTVHGRRFAYMDKAENPEKRE